MEHSRLTISLRCTTLGQGQERAPSQLGDERLRPPRGQWRSLHLSVKIRARKDGCQWFLNIEAKRSSNSSNRHTDDASELPYAWLKPLSIIMGTCEVS